MTNTEAASVAKAIEDYGNLLRRTVVIIAGEATAAETERCAKLLETSAAKHRQAEQNMIANALERAATQLRRTALEPRE